MKSKIFIPVMGILILFGNLLVAQQSSFVKSQIVNASADEVWERLRKLDGLEEIAPHLLNETWIHDNALPGVGVKRSCTAPGTPKGQASYTETILEFSDSERYYKYTVDQGTPTKNMINSLRVVDLGYHKSMVVWTSVRDGYIDNPQMTEVEFNEFLTMAGQSIVDGVAKLHNK